MVALWWLLIGLAAAADPVEGVWDYVSFTPNEGERVILADEFRKKGSDCDAFKLVLQIGEDEAFVIAETVCPVPAAPRDQGSEVRQRCIAATKIAVERDGSQLGSHPAAAVTAKLHRIDVQVTQEDGATNTSRKSVTRSCSASTQVDGFHGTLAVQDDDSLQLKAAVGTMFFVRTALRRDPL